MNSAREKAIAAGLAIVESRPSLEVGDAHRAGEEGLKACLNLDQSRLDVSIRTSISRLPWRGQFPPELIQYLIQTVCADAQTILDPFCGSGTVLFEAVTRGKSPTGCEVNPAAWHLASLALFGGLSPERKKLILHRLKLLAATAGGSLFHGPDDPFSIIDRVCRDDDPMVSRMLAPAILLGMRDDVTLSEESIARGAIAVLQVLNEFATTPSICASCYLADARHLSVESETMDAVITSPPYINVFNYHQNYRMAVELLGWRPLQAARSEIGANRKFRMNRFLTVIQYCLDMCQSLDEIARVLRPGAPLVLIIGRTSNVLGASFQNGAILSRLLAAIDSFGPVDRGYRVFTNRFGERIFEDLLIARRERACRSELEAAREIGVSALLDAAKRVSEKNRKALDDALARAYEVTPSTLLSLAYPPLFSACT